MSTTAGLAAEATTIEASFSTLLTHLRQVLISSERGKGKSKDEKDHTGAQRKGHGRHRPELFGKGEHH
jgi:hypothetical protein